MVVLTEAPTKTLTKTLGTQTFRLSRKTEFVEETNNPKRKAFFGPNQGQSFWRITQTRKVNWTKVSNFKVQNFKSNHLKYQRSLRRFLKHSKRTQSQSRLRQSRNGPTQYVPSLLYRRCFAVTALPSLLYFRCSIIAALPSLHSHQATVDALRTLPYIHQSA